MSTQDKYGTAGKGREYETNPDPRYNPNVAEQIQKSILDDETSAIAAAAHVIRASQWVAVTPLPDGKYEVTVKKENERLLPMKK